MRYCQGAGEALKIAEPFLGREGQLDGPAGIEGKGVVAELSRDVSHGEPYVECGLVGRERDSPFSVLDGYGGLYVRLCQGAGFPLGEMPVVVGDLLAVAGERQLEETSAALGFRAEGGGVE